MPVDVELPPAPQIDGEAMLEIFVHRSMKLVNTPVSLDSLYADGTRLALLGSNILEAVYMYLLFRQQPRLTVEEMEAQFGKLPELVEKWVEGYKWREKVRRATDVHLDPKETRYIMDTYVGAVFVGQGFAAVLNWVGTLVDWYQRVDPSAIA